MLFLVATRIHIYKAEIYVYFERRSKENLLIRMQGYIIGFPFISLKFVENPLSVIH